MPEEGGNKHGGGAAGAKLHPRHSKPIRNLRETSKGQGWPLPIERRHSNESLEIMNFMPCVKRGINKSELIKK